MNFYRTSILDTEIKVIQRKVMRLSNLLIYIFYDKVNKYFQGQSIV